MSSSKTRQSQFARTMAYFRSADLVEAASALVAAERIVQGRSPLQEAEAPRRTRRPRTNGAEGKYTPPAQPAAQELHDNE